MLGREIFYFEGFLAAAVEGALLEVEVGGGDSYFGDDGDSLELEVEVLVLVVEVGAQGVVPLLLEVDLCMLAQDVVAK